MSTWMGRHTQSKERISDGFAGGKNDISKDIGREALT